MHSRLTRHILSAKETGTEGLADGLVKHDVMVGNGQQPTKVSLCFCCMTLLIFPMTATRPGR